MMRYKNIIIVGTSHIAKQSLEEVKNTIVKERPGIIALELDKKRLYALLHKVRNKIRLKDIRSIGVKGYLFSLIGAWAERKLGESVGVSPGSEMLTAVKEARRNNIKIVLIDQDIEITLRRCSKTLSWKEKWFFIVDIIKAIIFKKKEVEFDLTKVPSKKIIRKMVNKVKERYPNIYRVLIIERNNIMARNLLKIMKKNEDKKILGIVGAGHEKDIINLIKRYENKLDFI
jgi:pheromone shutdown-related protein TraB